MFSLLNVLRELTAAIKEHTVALREQTKETSNMSQVTDRLTASVGALTNVAQSATALLNNLAQEIRDSAGDPVALNALADTIDSDVKELTDAVTANTPATPTA